MIFFLHNTCVVALAYFSKLFALNYKSFNKLQSILSDLLNPLQVCIKLLRVGFTRGACSCTLDNRNFVFQISLCHNSRLRSKRGRFEPGPLRDAFANLRGLGDLLRSETKTFLIAERIRKVAYGQIALNLLMKIFVPRRFYPRLLPICRFQNGLLTALTSRLSHEGVL